MIYPKDEVIQGSPRYNILDNNGNTIYSNVQIALANTVDEIGSDVDRDFIATCLGYDEKTTTFNEDGSITESDGTVTKTTTFNNDGTITETLSKGSESVSKLTTFNSDGTIDEEIVSNEEDE